MMPRFEDLVISRWGARFQGRQMPCAIGRGGIGIKTGEGDGISPKGQFRLLECAIRPDRLACNTPHIPQWAISLRDVWSDDPEDADYNHLTDLHSHRFSHERLRRADPLYDVFAVLDYNYPEATSGRGSAIFLHKWRKPRHPTEGCVAFAEQDLLRILTLWTRQSRVIIR